MCRIKVRINLGNLIYVFVDTMIIIQAIKHQIKSARSEVRLPSELTFFSDNDELSPSGS